MMKYHISVFYCVNSFDASMLERLPFKDRVVFKPVKMACSSMVKDVYLLRAFEADADAVVVLVCPEGHCRYVEGNLRAAKRIDWLRRLLDEIGIGGARLVLCHASSGKTDAAGACFERTLTMLEAEGYSPARSRCDAGAASDQRRNGKPQR